MIDPETLRFVFGLKLRHLRKQRNLSLKDLAEASGLSLSYINEIEKGKKYPKTDKILGLARCLGVSYDALISMQLQDDLAVFSQLMQRNMMRDTPMELFGIPAGAVLEIFGENPHKLQALLGTIFEIQRSHSISVEEFFQAALRSFVDAQHYRFPDLELASEKLRRTLKLQGTNRPGRILRKFLEDSLGCRVRIEDFANLSPELAHLQFIFGDSGQLIINDRLPEEWQTYILAKEIGYRHLELKERVTSSAALDIDSFAKIFNHFKASYFAGSLLIPLDAYKTSLDAFFSKPRWQPRQFVDLLTGFGVPARVAMHRIIQLLPSFYDVDRIFLLELDYDGERESFELSKQLHLTEQHAPYRLHSDEHYCRRWIAINVLRDAQFEKSPLAASAQRSFFPHQEKEYFCLSIGFPSEPMRDRATSVTLGFLLDDRLKDLIRFWDDPAIRRREVGHSCERCPLTDCSDRAAPPYIAKKMQLEAKMRDHIRQLTESPAQH